MVCVMLWSSCFLHSDMMGEDDTFVEKKKSVDELGK